MLEQHYTIPGASGKTISIDLLIAETPQIKPLAIFAHGFKGFKDWGTHQLVAKYFNEQGLNFLKFNFSHNGISAGGDSFDDLESFASNTFSKELFDLNQVITFALSGEKFARPLELFLIGHSLGGAISIITCAENKSIKKLATWASISNFRTLWSPQQEEEWRGKGVLYFLNARTKQQMPIYSTLLDDLNDSGKRLDIISAAERISQPWLIIHGENDTSVPPHHATLLQKHQKDGRLVLIPGADHVFNATHPWNQHHLPDALKQTCDTTIKFFKET